MTNGKINYPLMSAVRHIVVQAVARPCSQIRAVRASLAVRLAVADTLCPCHVPVPRTVVPPCGLKVAPLLVYAHMVTVEPLVVPMPAVTHSLLWKYWMSKFIFSGPAMRNPRSSGMQSCGRVVFRMQSTFANVHLPIGPFRDWIVTWPLCRSK